jgi:hypothetical protein
MVSYVTFDAMTDFREYLKIHIEFISGRRYLRREEYELGLHWKKYIDNEGCPLWGLEELIDASLKGEYALCESDEYTNVISSTIIPKDWASERIEYLLDIPLPEKLYGKCSEIGDYVLDHPARAFWIQLLSNHCSYLIDTTGASLWKDSEEVVVYEKICRSNLKYVLTINFF